MAGRSTGVHAVVWRTRDAPPDLIRALTQQGITWEEAAGPFEALSRVLAARRTCGRSRVLLLVEPASLEAAEEIRGALEKFDPATGCWAYRASGNPRLTPLAPAPRQAEPEIIVKPRATRAQPELRLARGSETPGDGGRRGPGGAPDPAGSPERARSPDRNPSQATPEPEEEPQSPRSLLTPEELAMLLADDPN